MKYLLTFVALSLVCAHAIAKNIPVPVGYAKVSQAYGVPAKIFFSIALVESRKAINSQKVMPWPWTLNVEGKAYRYANRKQAWIALNKFLTQKRSVDIGLMQVNWRYHKTKLKSTWLALDPFHNMRVSAQILSKCYRNKKDWWLCVGRYHSPGQKQAQISRAHGYRKRVLKQFQRVT